MSETKVIPKDVWKEFDEYWDNTEWENLTIADIKKHLGNGKYVFVPIPSDVTDKKIGEIWYDQMYKLREKGKAFGGYTVCFKDQKATLEEVFGDKPLSTTAMTKTLYLYINDHHLSSKAKDKPKPTADEVTQNIKKVHEKIKAEKATKPTKVVKSIDEMEKAVEKVAVQKNSKKQASDTTKK